MITHFRTREHYWQPEIAVMGRVTKFFFHFFVGKSDGEGADFFSLNKKVGGNNIRRGVALPTQFALFSFFFYWNVVVIFVVLSLFITFKKRTPPLNIVSSLFLFSEKQWSNHNHMQILWNTWLWKLYEYQPETITNQSQTNRKVKSYRPDIVIKDKKKNMPSNW